MSYLLDTHVWLWLLTEPERLRAEVVERLADSRARVVLSAVSGWEIAIRFSLGHLPLPERPATYVPERMRHSGVEGLAIEHVHALRVAELPPHHRDPFDRLLIAQAQVERLTLVTADEAFDPYDVERISAN